MSDNQSPDSNQANDAKQPTAQSPLIDTPKAEEEGLAAVSKNSSKAVATDDLDPAKQGGGFMRRWYPTSWVGKLVWLVIALLLAIVLAVYYAAGTEWGTRIFIVSIVQKTGISLKYGKGNLRDGLWIYDLTIPPKPPKNYVEIKVDKAFVKLGWRALLAKQVHLREATIGNMVITYKKLPSQDNKPFSYPRLALPVNVILDHATANLIRYQQVTKKPIDFKQAEVKDFSWIDAKVQVADGKLGYNELLRLEKLHGTIDLQNDYPLDATARIIVKSLSKAYFDALDTHATGSLKFLSADVKSLYNKSAVIGHLTAQPMQPNAPFKAKLKWQDVVLPYATQQNIHLKNGIATATGVTNNIELRVNTDLTAKDIPSGHYQGRANTDTKQLNVEELTATLPEGTLSSQGVINWQNRTHIALMNTAHNFKIRKLLAKNIAPYAPETLDGKLAIVYDVATATEPKTIKANLRQNDGEIINAIITQQAKKATQATGSNQPYHINANWQHVIRHNLPNVGELNSPTGKATAIYQAIKNKDGNTIANKLHVEGTANFVKLNAAPQGDYQVNLDRVGNDLDIHQLHYQGKAGDLSGNGKITLATKTKPLTWQIDAKTNRLDAHNILDSIPFMGLKGNVIANGILQHIRTNGVTLQRHQVHISHIDMLGDMLGTNNSKKHVTITGTGDTTIDLLNRKLNHIAAKFDGNLSAPQLPAGKLKLDIVCTPKYLQINQLSHQFVNHGNTSGINAKGSIDLTNGVDWNIVADMKQFDASFFAPSLPSRINGTINTDGYWRKTGQYVHIRDMNLTGTLKNQSLSAKGQLTAKLNLPRDRSAAKNLFKAGNEQQQVAQIRHMVEQLQANNLAIRWGSNQITATGNQNQLVASVDISTLNQLMPQLKGTVKGGLILTQNNQQALPTLLVDLTARDVSMPNFVALDATIKGKIVNLAKSSSQLQINATGLNIANQPLRALQLNFNGTQAAHTLDIKTDSTRGQVQATLKGAIDLNKGEWQGVVGNGQIGTRYAKLQQMQPAQLLVNWQNPTLELAAHCWQMAGLPVEQAGTLCLKDNLVTSANQGQINLAMQNLDSQVFSVVMPKDIAWSGKVNGTALVHWQKNQRPNVNVSVYSDNGVFGTAAQTPEEDPTTINYQRISVIARSTNVGLKLRADIKTANNAGDGYLDAMVDPYRTGKPIDGTVVFQDINLAVLKPFFPSFERLTGSGLIAGKIGGSLAQPTFTGDAEVQNASLGITGVPMRFDNINILTHVEGNQANINGTFTTPNSGKGNLNGTVDWHNELQAKLKLTGNELLVSQPPMITARINPIFDIIVKPAQRYVNVVGVIDVPRGIIRPPEQTANVVTESKDVNVIDRRLQAQIDEVLRVTQPWSINADIGVDIGNRVTFQGFGSRLPLAGALHLTQQGQGTMNAQGVVQVAKRSRADIFGQNLDINFAQVKFNGAVTKPTLNIEAVKNVQGVEVGVRVKGSTAQPDIAVFNNGGLTQQQAMNALVTGNLVNNTGQNTNSEDFRNRVNNTLAAAGLSAGLSSTRGFTNQIGRAFGLQSLTLDASGSSNDTEVNITGYITPDLYIRYGVGVFNATNTLSMRYQLTQRLYVEAKAAVNNSVDLIYNWRY